MKRFLALYQVFYFGAVFRKAQSMTTWGDTLRALFYGPGWFPGTPRLGDPNTFPDIKGPRVKYNPQLPRWQEVYVLVHFIIILLIHQTWITKVAVSDAASLSYYLTHWKPSWKPPS